MKSMFEKRTRIVIYFIILISIGTVGFYIIGGSKWSWIDSLYMTIITLSTVGYGEVHELGDIGKIWAILLIIFGVTGIGALLRAINEEFIQSKLFWNKKMIKNISKLKNHYIICGYGRMGAVIAKELKEKGQKFLIIENNDQKVEKIRSKGMFCINGDATSEEILKDAKIDKAIGVAVVLDTDQENLFVTMSMKTTNPDLFILSRCSKEDNQSKLLRAGANKVVNPYTAGGHRMAEILSKPQVEDSISVISPKHSEMNLTLDEISLTGLTKYDGISIKDSKIKEEFSVSIVGIIKEDGNSIINPNSDSILEMNDTILLIGENDKMNLFKAQLPS
ncbi:MAG: NAD-binding protein, partial [Candidatus Marinimicrobia bacterium]|nr:NAD-binding protein [Candidatus Neomarinimicrobiota bacterium]